MSYYVETVDLMSSCQVKFFSDFEGARQGEARHIPSSDASHMIATVFQEKTLRLYSRNRDARICEALAQAFSVSQGHLPRPSR